MMVIKIILLAIILLKTLFAFRNMSLSKDFLKEQNVEEVVLNEKNNKLLILIPVIREQNVIVKTLNHMATMDVEDLDVTLAVVGTKKEWAEKEQKLNTLKDIHSQFTKSPSFLEKRKILRGLFRKEIIEELISSEKVSFEVFRKTYLSEPMTSDVVKEWIDSKEGAKITYLFLETPETSGDRATQLNYAFEKLKGESTYDVVGVYDADSLPEQESFRAVVQAFSISDIDACQQPLHFLSSLKTFETDKVSQLISASAIYQTTWSMIKELPNLILYSKRSPRLHKRCLYLNGHGQFFRASTLSEIGGFPSDVITDGVHIGYRMSMSELKMAPIPYFCDDEMTDNAPQVIHQHSRWYGGCMTVKEAFDWSKKRGDKPSLFRMIDGYHLQMAWAYAPLFVIGTLLSIMWGKSTLDGYLAITAVVSLLIYNYLLPYFTIRVLLKYKGKIRLSTWLSLPLAAVLKAIGPNLYFFNVIKEKVFGEKIQFEKVER